MNAVAAGWYIDPTGRFQHRYWDGVRWTDHVGSQGVQSIDPIPLQQTHSSAQLAGSGSPSGGSQTGTPGVTQTAPTPLDVESGLPECVTVKVTTFNAKRVASELQDRYRHLADQYASLQSADEVELARRLAQARASLECTTAELTAAQQTLDRAQESARTILDQAHAETQDMRAQVDRDLSQARLDLAQTRAQNTALQDQLIVNRERLSLEELGLFDFEHPAESSAALASDLERVRSRIKSMASSGQAVTSVSNFTFNNSKAQGRTFVNQLTRLMLRAYNAEAENAVKSVRAGNLDAAKKRLENARTQISKQGQMIALSVTPGYHTLRLQELELAARHLQALAAEKERERERRAELREQKAVEAEIRREKEKLAKERAHYLNSIAKLQAAGDEQGAASLTDELARIDSEIEAADYRAANIRAGYVYVISNIGAFGEGVVKIGMTRRLDPMDRIRELGDASVPFTFDVHALFFSDDAVSIEAMLHRHFADQRLNKVNPRREFFRAHPQQVLDALAEHKVSLLEFTVDAAADDYRASWPEGYPAIAPPAP